MWGSTERLLPVVRCQGVCKEGRKADGDTTHVLSAFIRERSSCPRASRRHTPGRDDGGRRGDHHPPPPPGGGTPRRAVTGDCWPPPDLCRAAGRRCTAMPRRGSHAHPLRVKPRPSPQHHPSESNPVPLLNTIRPGSGSTVPCQWRNRRAVDGPAARTAAAAAEAIAATVTPVAHLSGRGGVCRTARPARVRKQHA